VDKFQELTIAPPAGLNLRDDGLKMGDTEFRKLQGWYPKFKGLLYKTPGSTNDLSPADLTGIGRVTGVHYHSGIENFRLHHCKATAGLFLPAPNQAPTVQNGAGTGDIFGGAAKAQVDVVYTWLGLSRESAIGPVASITPTTNTTPVDIIIPAFPAGVKGANIFARVAGINTEYTYIGTLDAAGTLQMQQFIGLPAARLDPIADFDLEALGAGGFLPGNKTYFIGLAWLAESGGTNPTAIVKIGKVKSIRLTGNESQIKVDNLQPVISANGAKDAYIFIGTNDPKNHPMMFVGFFDRSGGAPGEIIIDVLPTPHNAQTAAINLSGGADTEVYFSQATPIADPNISNKLYGIILRKNEAADVHELFMSRTEYVLNAGQTFLDPYDNSAIAPAAGSPVYRFGMILHDSTFEGVYAKRGNTYSSPQFEAYQGISYFVNGSQIPIQIDGYTMCSHLETFDTVMPRDLHRLIAFKDSLVYASLDTKNQIFATNANTPRNWVVGGTGTDLRFMTIGDSFDTGVEALGISAYTSADAGPQTQLAVCKKHGIWRTSAFSDPAAGIAEPLEFLSSKIGVVAYRAIGPTKIGTVFLGSDGILYLFRPTTGEPVPIGGKVQPAMEHLQANDTLGRMPTMVEHENHVKITYPSTSASTYNDAQLWADIRVAEKSPITWSGPHIGINIDAQIVDPRDNVRYAADSRVSAGVYEMDDTSTYQHIGSNVVSILETKKYDQNMIFHLKRIMGTFLEMFYDTAYTHNVRVQGFADSNYDEVSKKLSDGAAVWDSSSWDASAFGDALFFADNLFFGDIALLGKTYRARITHEDNALIIIKAIGILSKAERRRIT